MGGAKLGHPVRSHAAALDAEEEEVAHQPHGHQDQQTRQQQLQPVGGLRRGIVVMGEDALGVLLLNQTV